MIYRVNYLATDGNVRHTDIEAELNRLHICRGHFKHYTAERPLLGKITGTYWWADHARGNKERGQVIKDYEITG